MLGPLCVLKTSSPSAMHHIRQELLCRPHAEASACALQEMTPGSPGADGANVDPGLVGAFAKSFFMVRPWEGAHILDIHSSLKCN